MGMIHAGAMENGWRGRAGLERLAAGILGLQRKRTPCLGKRRCYPYQLTVSPSLPSLPASPAPTRPFRPPSTRKSGHTTRAMTTTHKEPLPETPIRHPDLIIPGVYLCDLHTAQDPVVSKSLGITHIVSVLDFHPTFPREMHDIKKLHVRLSDNFREKIAPHLDETTAFIREALKKDPVNKVLVRRRGYWW